MQPTAGERIAHIDTAIDDIRGALAGQTMMLRLAVERLLEIISGERPVWVIRVILTVAPITSGLPRLADIFRDRRHVSKVPQDRPLNRCGAS